jgi:hypothetical protein
MYIYKVDGNLLRYYSTAKKAVESIFPGLDDPDYIESLTKKVSTNPATSKITNTNGEMVFITKIRLY